MFKTFRESVLVAPHLVQETLIQSPVVKTGLDRGRCPKAIMEKPGLELASLGSGCSAFPSHIGVPCTAKLSMCPHLACPSLLVSSPPPFLLSSSHYTHTDLGLQGSPPPTEMCMKHRDAQAHPTERGEAWESAIWVQAGAETRSLTLGCSTQLHIGSYSAWWVLRLPQ